MTRIVVSAVVISTLLVGCGIFTRPMERPVIEDSIRQNWHTPAAVGVLSLTPERRIVLHNFGTRKFCAENPTEVGIDMASAARMLAAVSDEKTKAELGVALASASNNQVLNRRTQGLQLFQAASFTLCQLYLNEGMDQKDYIAQQMVIFKGAAALIDSELKTPVQVQVSAAPHPATAASAVNSMMANVAAVPLSKPAEAASAPSSAASSAKTPP